MEVTEIMVGGSPWPVYWSNRTTLRYGRSQGATSVTSCYALFETLGRMMQGEEGREIPLDDLEQVMTMAYYAIETGCQKTGKKFTLTKDDVLEEIFNTPLVATVVMAIYSTLPKLRPAEEVKKKI